MTNFTIDPSTDKIEVSGSKRNQAIVFSVGNKTGIDRRIRGLIDATPAEAASWFTVREPDTVPLRINETVQLTVDAEVPTDAIGEATLQLKVVATDDPDDTYGISQKIPVQVTAAKEQKRFPWWIVVAVVALVVVLGVVAFLVTRGGGEPVEPEQSPTPEPVPDLAITSILPQDGEILEANRTDDAGLWEYRNVPYQVETNYDGDASDLEAIWLVAGKPRKAGLSATLKLSAGCSTPQVTHMVEVRVLGPDARFASDAVRITVERRTDEHTRDECGTSVFPSKPPIVVPDKFTAFPVPQFP